MKKHTPTRLTVCAHRKTGLRHCSIQSPVRNLHEDRTDLLGRPIRPSALPRQPPRRLLCRSVLLASAESRLDWHILHVRVQRRRQPVQHGAASLEQSELLRHGVVERPRRHGLLRAGVDGAFAAVAAHCAAATPLAAIRAERLERDLLRRSRR